MKTNEIVLSPYRVKWIAICRYNTKDIIPQSDVKKFYKQEEKINNNSLWCINHNTKKNAHILLATMSVNEIKKYIANLKQTKGLKYHYLVYAFTDKQFGNASPKNKYSVYSLPINNDDYVLLTSKQCIQRDFIAEDRK